MGSGGYLLLARLMLAFDLGGHTAFVGGAIVDGRLTFVLLRGAVTVTWPPRRSR